MCLFENCIVSLNLYSTSHSAHQSEMPVNEQTRMDYALYKINDRYSKFWNILTTLKQTDMWIKML